MKALWSIISDLLLLIGFAAAVTAVSDARAADLRYDPAAAARRETIVRLYIDTRRCMGSASVAMMRMGARQQADVESFAVAACGNALRNELVQHGSFAPADADQLLRELAMKSLIEVLTR